MNTTIRHIFMIKCMPIDTHGQRTTAERIYEQLTECGFNVSRRTVQRDLVALKGMFGVSAERDENGFNWWYRTHGLEEQQ